MFIFIVDSFKVVSISNQASHTGPILRTAMLFNSFWESFCNKYWSWAGWALQEYGKD